MTDQVFRRRFRYTDDQQEYDFYLRRRRRWWLWLLLLLPLLLLIRCNKDITVHSVDCEGNSIPAVDVVATHTEHQILKNGKFFYKKEHNLKGQTDEKGLITFKRQPYSVYDFLFFHFKKVNVEGSKCMMHGFSSSRFYHHKEKTPYVVVLNGIDIHIIDCETGDDVSEATVKWRIETEDTGITDESGMVMINNPVCVDVIDYIEIHADGYADTVLRNVNIDELIGDDSVIEICLRPIDVPYTCDIVMCIDKTGSMSDFIDDVKNNLVTFHSDLSEYCEKHGRKIGNFRIKMIFFGDLAESYITETRFYSLPGEETEIRRQVDGIRIEGGDDYPENGLESVALAINSDWGKKGSRRRQIIIVYTDADAHPIEKFARKRRFPDGIPQTMKELTASWHAMNERSKRLILFAPAEGFWNYLSGNWDNVSHKTVPLNELFHSGEYTDVLKVICESL